MTLLRAAVGGIGRRGTWFLTVYAVLFGLLSATRQEGHVTLVILFGLSVLALVEASPFFPTGVREASLQVLRGGVVTALFVASADFGPTPEQAEQAGRDLVAAAVLGFLVMLAHARRAGEDRDERRCAAEHLEQVLAEVKALAARPGGEPTATAPAPATGSAPIAAAVAAAGLIGAWIGARGGRGS